MGDHVIKPHGHVKMMAAVQPFLSGAISKTANLTHDASVEDIEALYMDAWKLGVKALAVYRDNCKVAQPLSADTDKSPSSLVSAAESVVSSLGQPSARKVAEVSVQ